MWCVSGGSCCVGIKFCPVFWLSSVKKKYTHLFVTLGDRQDSIQWNLLYLIMGFQLCD